MAGATAISVPDWLIQAVVVLALGGGLTIICRSLARSVQAWAKEQFELLSAQTKEVAYQVTPNGGTTMSNGDITKRIEMKIDEHTQTDLKVQMDQTKEMKALREQLAAYHADLQLLNQEKAS